MKPLAGTTIVTLEHAIAAPFATRQLADLGARVIKVERPGARTSPMATSGSTAASHFVWTNWEGLTLDVKHPDHQGPDPERTGRRRGPEPGAGRRPPRCRTRPCRRKPEIIVCDISGYGNDGPYHRKAYDLLIQGEAGFLSVTGTEDTRPRRGRRSPTSPPGCTPIPASWRHCSSGRRPDAASTWTSPCWNRWSSG